MITAVRLQVFNPKLGHRMRSYVSANSATRYRAGTILVPSAWRIVDDPMELAELADYPQFQRKDFDSLAELQEFVQTEMEQGARLGLPPVRAAIEGLKPKQMRPAAKRDITPIILDEAAMDGDEDSADEPEPAAETVDLEGVILDDDEPEAELPVEPPPKPKFKDGKKGGKKGSKKGKK